MFKKANKLAPPPSPPTVSEIFEDLETFHVEKRLTISTRKIDPDHPHDAEWWKVFQTFLQDVDDFKKMQKDINGYRLKLESVKLEIDTAAKNIRNDIEENLEKAKDEIKD